MCSSVTPGVRGACFTHCSVCILNRLSSVECYWIHWILQVFVREYADASNYAMPRGGPGSSAHVEVLRNQHFISDLLHAAAGRFEEIDENKIDSSILEVSALIDQNRKNQ